MIKRRFRFRKRLGLRIGHHRRRKLYHHRTPTGRYSTLADVPSGWKAKVVGFTQYLPPERLSHFQAFGLVPGHNVRVLQHSPVTIVQIEHTELALERDLAREIQITEVEK